MRTLLQKHCHTRVPRGPASRAIWASACLLLAANLRLEDVLEPILDLLVRLVHFLVGQRAVVGLVGQRIRQALGARRDAVAAVQVEQPHAAQQVAAAGRISATTRSAGIASSTITAMSRSAAGKRGTGV